MSFSWVTNSWGGPVSTQDFYPGAANSVKLNTASVPMSVAIPPAIEQVIPQHYAHSLLYEVPPYIPLKDMTSSKNPLISDRGGYSHTDPQTNQHMDLSCLSGRMQSVQYCSPSQLKLKM